MAANNTLSEKLKNIVRQISGKLQDFEGDLYPEYVIHGRGAMFCLSADNKSFVKIL